MKTLPKILLLAAAIAPVALCAEQTFVATELYFQPFDPYMNGNTASERTMNVWTGQQSEESWVAYNGSTGVAISSSYPVIQTGGTIYSSPTSTNGGYVAVATGESLTLDLGDYDRVDFTIDASQSSSQRQVSMRFLVQLEGSDQWYATTAIKPAYGQYLSSPADPLITFTFTTDKTAWSLLDISTDDPGTEEVNEAGVVLSALAEDLPTTSITGFGWYWYSTTTSGIITRFDNLAITGYTLAIPEPAATALLAGSVFLLGAFVRRRFRHRH
jgi:hypothetical protein